MTTGLAQLNRFSEQFRSPVFGQPFAPPSNPQRTQLSSHTNSSLIVSPNSRRSWWTDLAKSSTTTCSRKIAWHGTEATPRGRRRTEDLQDCHGREGKNGGEHGFAPVSMYKDGFLCTKKNGTLFLRWKNRDDLCDSSETMVFSMVERNILVFSSP